MNVTRNLGELFQYVDVLGWSNGLSVFTKVKLKKTDSIRLKGVKHPITLRSGTSDIYAFKQVFILLEYAFEAHGEPKFIIDGGSNVGLAAVYFANRFPKATIVSIEPESSNFEMIKRNTQAYPAVHPIKSGLWSSSTFLKIRDLGLGNWGFVVEEQDHEDKDTFRAVSIGDLMKQFNQKEIDILKLDVEGAEKEIFTKNYEEWLPYTNILVVELHDRMKKGCSKAFFKAMIDHDFSIHQLGENLICTREKKSAEPTIVRAI
jgi:FkbM family methyltransferase